MRALWLASHRGASLAALGVLVAVALGPRTAAAQHSSSASSSTARPPEGWSRAPRWQAALHDGSYLWELTPTGLSGDTLVARQADSVVRVPLAEVDELRLVEASIKRVGAGGRGTFGGLAGADDEVYTLARYGVDERRRIVEQALAAHAPAADSGARPAERPR
jgi:hypothetical protein